MSHPHLDAIPATRLVESVERTWLNAVQLPEWAQQSAIVSNSDSVQARHFGARMRHPHTPVARGITHRVVIVVKQSSR